MDIEVALVISQILAFLALLWVMKKWAWRPFMQLLKTRQETIQTAFESIEEQKKEVQALIDAYTQKLNGIEEMTRLKLEEAAQEGRVVARQMQEEAQKQAREILEKAQASITHELTLAQYKLHDQVVALVMQATEKLLSERIDPDRERKRITQLIEEVKLK